MKLLHRLAGEQIAYIWASVWGANGRAIDPAHNRWDARQHLWAITRGTPPPIATEGERGLPVRLRRSYWMPYNEWGNWSREEQLTPICGRIRSRSTRPSWQPIHRYNNNATLHCPACASLVLQRGAVPQLREDLISNDPWIAIRGNQTTHLPDPVSGM